MFGHISKQLSYNILIVFRNKILFRNPNMKNSILDLDLRDNALIYNAKSFKVFSIFSVVALTPIKNKL